MISRLVGGYYCAEGSAAPLPCPGGTTMHPTLEVMTSDADCVECGVGVFCPVGSANATLCAPGTINPLTRQESCARCAAGKYQDLEGNTTCKPCPGGCATRCGLNRRFSMCCAAALRGRCCDGLW